MADVVRMADAALYEAKKAGRNCVRATALRESAKHPAALLAVG
jgi:hypothetical protein